MALTVKGSWLKVHGSKIQNSLHAYMILLKHPMNKWIDVGFEVMKTRQPSHFPVFLCRYVGCLAF